MTDVFPITIPCNGVGHSSLHYQQAFLAAKPADLTWYGYDVIIRSRTEVEFVVHGMRDSIYGGLGTETARLKTTVPKSLTTDDVRAKIRRLAEKRRAEELAAIEEHIIGKYMAEIVNELVYPR